MPLKIYNTQTRQKQLFESVHPKQVNLYVCGVTVYDECHVGHSRVYVVFDMMVRYLEYLGYQVKYVRNITDIDDKIIEKAQTQAQGQPVQDAIQKLTTQYTQQFHQAMQQLGLRVPQVEPRATENVPEMLKLIESLLKKRLAYVVEGDVYFDITRFPQYGKLSHRNIEEMKAGARVEVDPKKHHPLDFALWKKAKPREPVWESPWGPGRPGWHVECSAMSMKYLGIPIDIHGGGQDLIFPHHENELAQSVGATGKEFVRFWIHNGFVTLNKEKMSKSLGNFFTLQEVFQKFSPRVVHFYLLTQHYRSPIEFSDAALKEAQEILKKIENCLTLTQAQKPSSFKRDPELTQTAKSFLEAMNDDFNTPKALAFILQLVSEINTAREKRSFHNDFWMKYATLLKVLQILGIPTELCSSKPPSSEIQSWVAMREAARKEKKFALADQMRKKIQEAGYQIEDTPEGPRLRDRNT